MATAALTASTRWRPPGTLRDAGLLLLGAAEAAASPLREPA
jgi:hypothetical protein